MEVYDGSADGGGSFLGATELPLSSLTVNANIEEFTLPLMAQLAATEIQKGTVTFSCRLSSVYLFVLRLPGSRGWPSVALFRCHRQHAIVSARRLGRPRRPQNCPRRIAALHPC